MPPLIQIPLLLCLASPVPRALEPPTPESDVSLERRGYDCTNDFKCCTMQVSSCFREVPRGRRCAHYFYIDGTSGTKYRCRSAWIGRCANAGRVGLRRQCPVTCGRQRNPDTLPCTDAEIRNEVEKAAEYIKTKTKGLMGGFADDFDGVDIVELARYGDTQTAPLLKKFQRLVDVSTQREKLLDGKDYKTLGIKKPLQSQFNTMEVVGVYRFVDPRRWQLFTAQKEIMRRKGRVPIEERMTEKVISTPRREDALYDDIAVDPTDENAAVPLNAELNEMFLFQGTKPDTIPAIFANGVDERWGSLLGLFGGGAYFAELASKSDQYVRAVPCKDCTCMKRDEGAGVFPLFLSRVAMGRTYGGLNNGRTIEKPVAPTFNQRVVKQKGLFAGDAVDKQLFRKALDVQAKGWVGKKYKDTPKTQPQPLSVIGAGFQFARSRKKWEEKNDGLEFVVYDGSQVYTNYLLLYRRTYTQTSVGDDDRRVIKREWEVSLGDDKMQFSKCKDTLVMDPFELAAIEYTGSSGSDVKRSSKRKAWEYAYLEEPRMAQGREDNDVVELRYNTRVGKHQKRREIQTTLNVHFEDGDDATDFRYELDRRIKYLKQRAPSILRLHPQRRQRSLFSQ